MINVFLITVMAVNIALMIAVLNSNRTTAENVEPINEYTQKKSHEQDEKIQILLDEMECYDAEIELILNNLYSIINDIHELDERTYRISKDEKEIRSYYVNFREPVDHE